MTNLATVVVLLLCLSSKKPWDYVVKGVCSVSALVFQAENIVLKCSKISFPWKQAAKDVKANNHFDKHMSNYLFYVAFLDGLCLNSTKYMILDWNWRDQKLRRMMDIPEVLYKHLYIFCIFITFDCSAQILVSRVFFL